MPCLNRPGSTSIIRFAPLAGISIEALGASCVSGRLTFLSNALDNVRVCLRCLDLTPVVPGARAVLGEAFEITPSGLAFLPGGRATLMLSYDAVHVVDPGKVRVYSLEAEPDGWVPLADSEHVFEAASQRLLHVRLSGVAAGGRYVVAEGR